ncbi:phage tail protein I [Bartonella sp. DGB2]|uniref:phage tail protein I n=3 Tax=Bartonella sp. DGB2 TaxID=3388426 RepID=UPI00398FCAC2
MSAFSSLLPARSTAFERNLEQATSFPSLPIDALADFTNPDAIAEHLLPWLAFRFGIEIWNDQWTIAQKRQVIARAFELQRIKGTAAGLKTYIALVGSELRQIVTPPQRMFLSEGMSKDKLEAWHSEQPQIRIRFVKERFLAQGEAFCGQGFLNHSFLLPSRARQFYGRRASLWQNGKETPLTKIDLPARQKQRVERFLLAGEAGQGAFLGKMGRSFLGVCKREPQIITIRQDVDYYDQTSPLWPNGVSASLEPMDVRPKRMSSKGEDAYGMFCGKGTTRFLGRNFLLPSKAHEMIYDSIALYEQKPTWAKRTTGAFLGHCRLSMPAYQAEVAIDLKVKSRPRSSFLGVSFLGKSFLYTKDHSQMQQVARAIALSKAQRDQILVTWQTTRPRRFDDQTPLNGSVRFNSALPFQL